MHSVRPGGLTGPVRYLRHKQNNFGDNLNDVLFGEVFPRMESLDQTERVENGICILAIGTILNAHLNVAPEATVWVMGSGAGYNPQLPNLPKRSRLFFVRGPLTCQFCSLPEELALADGAYLLANQIRAAAKESTFSSQRIGIIPHHESAQFRSTFWNKLAEDSFVVDPREDWRVFVQKVSACDLILTECLHGAIAADILRRPFMVFATTPVFHSFKWLDWAAALDLSLTINFFDFHNPEGLAKTGSPILSKSAALSQVLAKLDEKKHRIQRMLKAVTEQLAG